MDKIYSRKRFTIPKCAFFKSNIPTKGDYSKKRRMTVIVILVIAVLTANFMIHAISPVIEKLCKDKAKNIATNISNEQATLVMAQYEYEDLVTITRDSNGNVSMIKANVIPINKIISDIPVKILEQYKKERNNHFTIPLGSFSGVRILAGTGPEIKIKIATVGNIETNLKSEFSQEGINQTLHRIYLELICEVSILTPFQTIEERITNQVLLAESVIVGTVPNTYYNLEGLNQDAAVRLIE